MTPLTRKKLIEVALPLEAINRESAREKSIRHGHPSTLHLWWARRPLAACRAVLFASLVDDPNSDPTLGNWAPDELEQRRGEKRQDLFDLIEQLVKWENSNNEAVIRSARAEIARCVASRKIETGELKKNQILTHGITPWEVVVKGHVKPIRSGKDVVGFDTTLLPKAEAVDAFLAEYAPPVLDPFAGGGSIPLEAQRLGLRAYASDLNPVPVLINKALIEIPPQFAGKPPVNPQANARLNDGWTGAQGLANDVRYYGQWMREEAEKQIGHLYPKVDITVDMTHERTDLKEYIGQTLTVIAWIWARTIQCPNPACGAKTPVAKTFELSGKKGNEAHVEPLLDQHRHEVRFRVTRGKDAPRAGNVNRRGADCLLCGTPIPLEYVRDEATGGRMGQQMMAIIAEGRRNRVYLSPIQSQVDAAEGANDIEAWTPSTTLPDQALGFRVQRYGMRTHAALFSRRQVVALSTFADLVRRIVRRDKILETASGDYSTAVATYLAFALSKAANYWSSLCSWYVKLEKMVSTFGLPTLSMVWDFTEANPFSDSSGNWSLGIEQAASGIENLFPHVIPGSASQLDATQHAMSFKGKPLISTDPPYYDNIGYANLSDFFYVWLRRCLSDAHPMLFSTVLTPKDAELIAEPGRFDNDRNRAIEHFEHGSTAAFTRFRTGADLDLPMTVFYAFKQQEHDEEDETNSHSTVSSGWEKMLASLISAGCSIQGTWPVRTEQTGGLREAKRNALASSIVLVCRPRPSDAPLATRKEFMAALRRELPDALKNLQRGNIAPVDMAQAAIGPGMATFTRYSKVVESDASPMTVRTALGIINQVLDEVLAEQEGEFDTDTRWAVAWFDQFGMEEGAFGMAETLSKAKNTAVNGLEEGGIIRARSGKVRLLKREELSADWDPATDSRVSAWEVTQYLIHALETGGETAAATLLRKLGELGETARDLAYRLFHICERKGWASEAISYNGLVIAWPELSRLARTTPSTEPAQTQTDLF
jgi:putative DNA methylase